MKIVGTLTILALAVTAYQPDEVLLEKLTNEIVPDHEFMLVEAHATIKAMKDDSACADLAKSLVSESQTTHNQFSKSLSDAADPSDCNKLGQGLVKAAEARLVAAKKDVETTTKALQAATEAPVAIELPLSKYSCDSVMGQAAFKKASKAKEDAKTATITASAAKKAAADGLQNAKADQAAQILKCKCAAEIQVEKVWAALEPGQKQRREDYAKGIKMQCVLAGTDLKAAECQKKLEPLVKPKDIVDEGMCVHFVPHMIGIECNPGCGLGWKTISGYVDCHDVRNKDAKGACVKIGLVKPAIPTKKCAPTKPCPTPAPTTRAPTTAAPTKSRCYSNSCCVSYISGGCSEERREGWDGEERRECKGNNGYRCRGATSTFMGCYWGGNNDCQPARL